MSIAPLITFKAGRCEGESSIKCSPEPGLLYIYVGLEDELVHFCWRKRSQSVDEPEIDLLMFPGDATFIPYTGKESDTHTDVVKSPTSGRIVILKFSSSSQRHLFWLQSKPEHSSPNRFSKKDLKLVSIVNSMLSGDEVDLDAELAELNSSNPDDEDDQEMEDADSPRGPRLRANSSTGGAGADATGGDIREEGSESREGGADGARAAAGGSSSLNDNASTLVQNFLNSLKGGSKGGGSRQEKVYTTLGDLLTPDTCVPVIQSASPQLLDSLLSNLPPAIILLETRTDDLSGTDPTPAAAEEAIKSLSEGQKKSLLIRVLRSPQLHQSLGSLTVALRDGGLPTVAGALNIDVENDGFIPGGAMPLGGGDAVEAFVKGVERTVKKDSDDRMDMS